METKSDLISAYNELFAEAIQDYAENHKSSIAAKHLNCLKIHVASYCTRKISDRLPKIPECINGAQIEQEVIDEANCCEQEKCMEQAQIDQSSDGPTEIPECNNGTEREQETLEKPKCSEQRNCMEPSQICPSSAGPSKIIIDMDPFMKLMTEHHKQQQEFQEKIFKTLLDHLNHQQTLQEQNQKQQNKFYELFLQQQQDFQSKLVGDLMKHTEMQVTLLSQTLSNSKTEQPVQDDHVNTDKKDTSCYIHSSPETTYNSNTSHNSISGGDAAEKLPPFSHYTVANRDKRPFQLFDRHDLGQEFCQWFYNRLNSTQGQENPGWDPNIFWEDVKCFIRHGSTIEEHIGIECVSSRFLEMTQKEKLTFTPKLDNERFKCVNSKHGLVVVAVTGVVSNNENFSGVFNQIFGLIMCPTTNHYRIRSIHLTVDDSDLFSSEQIVPPLQYSTEQLKEFS